MENYSVYIIQSLKDNSYYIGYSSNVAQRILKHNSSKKGYTSTKKPWALVYSELFQTKTEALIRELFLKNMTSLCCVT